MKLLLFLAAWCILFILFWPLALLVLFAAPLIWLIWLPFRFVALAVEAFFAFLRSILFLPARLLGHKG